MATAPPIVPKPNSKTCVVNQGRKKIHCILTDETEMVEEYDGMMWQCNLLLCSKFELQKKLLF